MAEEPKINPSTAPTQPTDVPTYPDPAPARPFDVAVTTSPGPASPFDVKVTPDPGPRQPFDVKVDRDTGPSEPVDVATYPSPGPWAPVDVQTRPDATPALPIDVQTRRDSAPAVPFDVQTTPLVNPPLPFDVPLTLTPAAGAPIDVTITRDPSPAEPINVPITVVRDNRGLATTDPHRYLQPPIDVIPSAPALDLGGGPGGKPTIDALISAVGGFNSAVGAFLGFLVEVNPLTVDVPGGGALDPRALAGWFRDYVGTVGGPGVAKFIAQQAILYSMNPVTARVFDPSYFLKMLIPGSMGRVGTTLDTLAGLTAERVAEARDAVLQAKVNSNPMRPGGDGYNDRPDTYGPENTFNDGQDFSVDAMVDAALPGIIDSPGGRTFLKKEGDLTAAWASPMLRFDASSYFESRQADGAQRVRATTKSAAASGIVNVLSSRLAKSAAINGIIRASIPGEELDGSTLSPTEDPSSVVDDDDARVPISFTDLRKDPVKNAYRSVYFRPLNLGFSNSVSPEYAETSAFGRVDSIVSYQKTSRTFSVNFELVAFAPEDLRTMYNKMVWLQSMCYPTFGADSLIRSGPVVRMRIGDAVSTELGGVPGVIRSLAFDFNDAMWELKRGMKVPRSFKVSVDFLALHDGPVGIMNGVFGVFRLPASGMSPDKDTNFADGPMDSQDSTPDGASVLPGRFSKFGEPRR